MVMMYYIRMTMYKAVASSIHVKDNRNCDILGWAGLFVARRQQIGSNLSCGQGRRWQWLLRYGEEISNYHYVNS